MRLAEGLIPRPRRAPCGCRLPSCVHGSTSPCDGEGIAGHAGAALLAELADRLGLSRALSWRAGRGQTARHHHDAGRVLRDLAVLVADGGDCLSDLGALHNHPELFGEVASTATAWRVIEQVASDEFGVARLRTGGATHGFVDHLRDRGVRFSVSLPADERVRAVVLAVPPGAWILHQSPARTSRSGGLSSHLVEPAIGLGKQRSSVELGEDLARVEQPVTRG
jgi:hypothetical protein